MNIGIIGLGKIGAAIASRLIAAGYTVTGFDPNQKAQEDAKQLGIVVESSIGNVAHCSRVIWLFVPAGPSIDQIIEEIRLHGQPNDIIIDGGNSFFQDSIRRATHLSQSNIHFIDCGTSGGIHGKENGFCLMIGGNRIVYDNVLPIFYAIAAPNGFAYCGPSGAGHYVKMVHNGIEYGLLQAYAEGFSLLHHQTHFPTFNLQEIAHLWNHGSIIRSWLLELTIQTFKEQGQSLDTISGTIQEGGTGRWTLQEATRQKISMPALEAALTVREQSRENGGDYSTALISALRHAFGGHPYQTKE